MISRIDAFEHALKLFDMSNIKEGYLTLKKNAEANCQLSMLQLFILSKEPGCEDADKELGESFLGKIDMDWLAQEAKICKFAKLLLAWCYLEGFKVELNLQKCLDLLEEAGKLKVGFAYIRLAKLYSEGHTKHQISPDLNKAITYFTLATNEGSLLAIYLLADLYRKNPSLENHQQIAFSYFLNAANKGSVAAQNELGMIYEQGIGVQPDLKKAFRFFKQAADRGYDVAKYNISYFYFKGKVVNKDFGIGFSYCQAAAEAGIEEAQLFMGEMLLDTSDPQHDPELAFKYFMMAAKKEDAFGLFRVGYLYFYGHGVAQNKEEAKNYLHRAVEKKHYGASCLLGHLYLEEGYNDLAAYYFQLSADNGNAEAQYETAICFEKGIGFDADLEKACHYHLLAAANGNELSSKALDHLNSIMNPNKRKSGSSDEDTSPNKKQKTEHDQSEAVIEQTKINESSLSTVEYLAAVHGYDTQADSASNKTIYLVIAKQFNLLLGLNYQSDQLHTLAKKICAHLIKNILTKSDVYQYLKLRKEDRTAMLLSALCQAFNINICCLKEGAYLVKKLPNSVSNLIIACNEKNEFYSLIPGRNGNKEFIKQLDENFKNAEVLKVFDHTELVSNQNVLFNIIELMYTGCNEEFHISELEYNRILSLGFTKEEILESFSITYKKETFEMIRSFGLFNKYNELSEIDVVGNDYSDLEKNDDYIHNHHFQLALIKSFINENRNFFIHSTEELEKVAKKHGLECHDVQGNGNCFFYAAADQLIRKLDLAHSEENVENLGHGLRKIALEYLEKNHDKYKGFILDSEKIQDLGKDKAWADDIIIDALCSCIHVNLICIRSDGANPTVKRFKNALSNLILGYEVGIHYLSLVPIMTDEAKKAHQQLTNLVKAQTIVDNQPEIHNRQELKQLVMQLMANKSKIQLDRKILDQLSTDFDAHCLEELFEEKESEQKPSLSFFS